MDLPLIIYAIFSGLLFLFLLLMLIELVQDLFFKKVPYVRSENKVISHVLGSISPKQDDKFYDLGAGDGKFLRALIKKYPKISAVGFEKSFLPYIFSKFLKKENYKIKFKNFYKVDLSDADYIYAYLYPEYMKKLEPKIQSELKPGAYFISSTFSFPNWKPIQTIPLNPNKKNNWGKLFIYKK